MYQNIGKGFIVGSTMLIPGVSGGTMAMALGIYDRLIHAVASWRKAPKENTAILLQFVLGASVGMLLFAKPLSILLERYPRPVLYFFMGAVFGGIPIMEKKSGVHKISAKTIFWLLAGTSATLLITFIPIGIISVNYNPFALMATGILAAVALILPGISVSHVFLVLGMYELLLQAIMGLHFRFVIPLGLGVLIGIILFSKLLEKVMHTFTQETYLLILGFILGSLAQVFPGIPQGAEIVICLGMAVMGFGWMYALTVKYEK